MTTEVAHHLVPQVPSLGNYGLIDLDTPKNAYFKKSYKDGNNWKLVFSDEFNTDGRSFYPGDDPYWEAADFHYWVCSFKHDQPFAKFIDLHTIRLPITSNGTIQKPSPPQMDL